MALTNQSKPVTSVTNSDKVSVGETWASITTTWASETRTWLEVSQLIDNQSKVTQGVAETWDTWTETWNAETRTWDELGGGGGITNQSKP